MEATEWNVTEESDKNSRNGCSKEIMKTTFEN